LIEKAAYALAQATVLEGDAVFEFDDTLLEPPTKNLAPRLDLAI
jgi:hypothetical protein